MERSPRTPRKPSKNASLSSSASSPAKNHASIALFVLRLAISARERRGRLLMEMICFGLWLL
ncbi:hypothetical protein CFP56_004326 [Quercus suber]|uniref:Uncharacterized protein n=1 Tax=Quercus suber TaxID=58331 RepID=A0AAW0IHA1_QUESU